MNSIDKIKALEELLISHPSYLTIIKEIEKDLEVLEILKERKAVIQVVSNSNGNNTILKETYQFSIGCYDEDYFKIKRWVEE